MIQVKRLNFNLPNSFCLPTGKMEIEFLIKTNLEGLRFVQTLGSIRAANKVNLLY
jgi:hypothetical protein